MLTFNSPSTAGISKLSPPDAPVPYTFNARIQWHYTRGLQSKEMDVKLISARQLIRDFICHVVSTATQIELDLSRLPLVRQYTQVP